MSRPLETKPRNARIVAVLARWERTGQRRRGVKRLAAEARCSEQAVRVYLEDHAIDLGTSKYATKARAEGPPKWLPSRKQIAARCQEIRDEHLAEKRRQPWSCKLSQSFEPRIYRVTTRMT